MKIISLNIEKDLHLNRFIPFILKENPDVLCLQEVVMLDLPKISQELNLANVVFQAMSYHEFGNRKAQVGIAILSKKEFTHTDLKGINLYSKPYVNSKNILELENYFIISADLQLKNQQTLTVVCSHFPVTKEGSYTEYQNESVLNTIEFLKKKDNFIFCADTNSPRGGINFSLLAENFIDNIPLGYKTSIDQHLHRVKGLQFMVDSLFTNRLKAKEVHLHEGVSDHMAVVAVFDIEI